MSSQPHPDSNRAVLFPGQGSQFVGMAKDLFENEPAAREMFEVAWGFSGSRFSIAGA